MTAGLGAIGSFGSFFPPGSHYVCERAHKVSVEYGPVIPVLLQGVDIMIVVPPIYPPEENIDIPKAPKGSELEERDEIEPLTIDFAYVEERLLMAWRALHRSPDPSRHSQWIRMKGTSIFRDMLHEWNEHGAHNDHARRIEGWGRVGSLTTAEVDRMEEGLGWIEWIRTADRIMIGCVLAAKLSNQARPDWDRIAGYIDWRGHRSALSRRYDNAIKRITAKLIRDGYREPVIAERDGSGELPDWLAERIAGEG